MAISMPFSRPLPEFQPVSVMRRGFSSKGFSLPSTPSISIVYPSSFMLRSLRPLASGFRGLGFVSRDVIAYSHKFVAVSQSSTVPSFAMGLLIDMPDRGLCIELSP